MLIELIDEVALNHFECLVHTIEDQIVPVWREAHKLTEAARIKLDQHKRNRAIKQAIFASAKFDMAPRHWMMLHHLRPSGAILSIKLLVI